MTPGEAPDAAASDDWTECRELGEVLSRIGDKWTVMVVGALSQGPLRFNQLRRTIGGVSQRMLTLTVRGLERDGLVARTVFPSKPPRVDYELTALGHTLIEPLRTLSGWARAHRVEIRAAREAFRGAPEAPAADPPARGSAEGASQELHPRLRAGHVRL